MNTTTIVKTTTKTSTWLGARATVTEHRLERKVTGLRVHIMVWHDDSPRHGRTAGDMVARMINGDGTKGTLETLDEIVVPNGTDADAEAFLAKHGVTR
jgi:hypothetical protein